jgi:hypothetical protein
MTEAKKRAPIAAASGAGRRSGTTGREKPRAAAAPQPGRRAERGQSDQLRAIFTKGLDLAEASLSLGLTVINRVGSAAQEQLLSVTRNPQPHAVAPPDSEHAAGVRASAAPKATAPEPPPAEEPQYCITNRLPLAPGGPVKVSFSINNDAVATPKKVRVRLEGFAGETEGARLASEGFTLTPTLKTIAPMDFETFVLQGAVPPETPPDVYQGWVVVSSGEEFRIPVRLVILAS